MTTKTPLVVAYGLGVDSTAVLVGMHARGERPDLILFADTGNEKDETYAYLPVINEWLRKVGFPEVIVVTNVVKTFKHYPPYATLGENCLTNGTLPSLAFGFKSCSLKWKVAPQNRYVDEWAPAIECWAAGGKVRKVIGYDDSPADRKRFAHSVGMADDKYAYEYPLITWGWDRDRCKAEIVAAGLPVPPKSACYFCPATKAEELHTHKAIYLRYIVLMEMRAKVRLMGHFNEDEIAKYNAETMPGRTAKWIKGGCKGKAPKPYKVGDGTRGLWRGATKAHTGMMTDYIREHGLLPAAEIDRLIDSVPTDVIDEAGEFDNGVEIPEWHDFIEAFTPEDALPVLATGCGSGGCGGCTGCVAV